MGLTNTKLKHLFPATKHYVDKDYKLQKFDFKRVFREVGKNMNFSQNFYADNDIIKS